MLIESGTKPLTDHWRRIAEPEAGCPVPKVENHPTLPRPEEVIEDLSLIVDHRELLGEDVGVNVAGT